MSGMVRGVLGLGGVSSVSSRESLDESAFCISWGEGGP